LERQREALRTQTLDNDAREQEINERKILLRLFVALVVASWGVSVIAGFAGHSTLAADGRAMGVSGAGSILWSAGVEKSTPPGALQYRPGGAGIVGAAGYQKPAARSSSRCISDDVTQGLPGWRHRGYDANWPLARSRPRPKLILSFGGGLSVELVKAKDFVGQEKHKKALGMLWAVEAKARTNLEEAHGLVDVATAIREHVTRGALTECDQLLSLGRAAVTRLESDARTGALVVIPNCRCLGGSGLNIEPSETDHLDLIFHQHEVRLKQRDRLVSVPYADLTSLEVGEPAIGDTVRSKTKRAAVRVGTTAALGAVMLPVALPLLLVKSGTNTGIALQTDSAELFLLHRSDTRPDEWRMRLSEVFVRVEESRSVAQPEISVADSQSEASAAGGDVVARLERLARLREQGVISDDELQRLKADILATG
jgi:hypothetical protein